MDKKNYALSSKCPTGPGGPGPRQDGSGGNQTFIKNHPRSTPRRRESPNGHHHLQPNNGTKSRSEATPIRKPTSQKSKAMDKRPRARGGNHLQPVAESEPHKEPELGSLQTPGSKKQSLNHLLNFHFAPRESGSLHPTTWRSYNTHPGGGWRAHHSSGGSIMRPKFNKENFLQANCQFLVKSTGDYSVHRYNPDLLVDWELIEQIYIRVAGEFPHCPICLSPPVAAKMTKCGHIFCWPCLLHYLALSDKKSRKCPICFESVYKHELKSVVATRYEDVHVGEEIEMQLMFRKKGLFQAKPLMCKDTSTFNWESIFSKLIPVTPSEVKVMVIEREELELRERYEEEKHCPEACFVEQALQELEARRSNVTGVGEVDESKLTRVLGALNLNRVEWMSTDSSPSADEGSNFEAGEVEEEESSCKKQRNDSTGNESSSVAPGSDDDVSLVKGTDSDEYFYFYQAIKGENVFLHPINMAMLRKAFGNDPTVWPQVVQFRVIEKEYVIMMEETRKRLKFLQHLPLTSNVQLVEVELNPPVVSEAILTEFSHQLDTRKKRRAQKARDERRRERKLEEEERKKDFHRTCPQFELKYDFPEFSYNFNEPVVGNINDTVLMEDAVALSSTEEDASLLDTNCNLDGQDVLCSSSPGMSFAQIVSQKSSQTGMTAGAAWGIVAKKNDVSQNSSLTGKASDTHSEADSEEYSPVPTYRMSMSDAIARAIANKDVDDGESQSHSSKKGRGRKKGKVLFATGMGCYK